ncbi:N-carbamoyl-L-amino-acid hydrolase [Malonomonas rubra DSM 5091]|uniref:N-carbamoyl-L-amino-acid hydrolase n=1 Tax=Malonomonas rubra DSM 5091 TaxID=1122189 RepID=A0A1M6F479_MALRU|nr:M20 family metallo-hydrolase [Malonomonas rubra]SHI92473.1 N-carbamoyl-L-amino-acid hydrolase [Malonomonas rubra DSM 5091]
MRVSQQRLQNDLEAIGRFGRLEKGGYSRLAFTEPDRQARNWLQQQMRDIGLDVSIDALGNIRGRREGKQDLPPVLIGSHLDTVPEGGNYDGIIGVLAGLEVIRVLNEQTIKTERPIEVVNFSAEESSRFSVATLGSKAMAGKLAPESLQSLVDKEGCTLQQALHQCGYSGEPAAARIAPGQLHAFLELHIEQGPVLEAGNVDVGIVTAIAAATRFRVTIEGRADHSGNTPMGMRKDALAAASEIVLGVEQICGKEAGERTVGTVGYQHISPGAMNVVPGRVELGIDIRDVKMADKDVAVAKVIALMKGVAQRRDLKIDYQQLCNDQPVELSPKIIDCLQKNADQLHLSSLQMPSGAGHDAMNLVGLTDVGMIFVPSVDGVSHNVAEFSRMEDICRGSDLLLHTVLQLAQE